MVTRHAWITSLSVLVACADPPISFFDEPRPCELLGEVCPPAIPTQLELVDFDHDGRDEFVILGLEGELVVGNPEDGEVLASARVEVEWGTTLSRCSSADLVFQHTLEQWWLWELTDARIEAADGPMVTSVFHQSVRLEDRWGREILTRADGTRTVEVLGSELDAVAASPSVTAAEAELWRSIRSDLPGALGRFAHRGLLVG